jgi:hypothetical protein
MMLQLPLQLIVLVRNVGWKEAEGQGAALAEGKIFSLAPGSAFPIPKNSTHKRMEFFMFQN